MAATLSRPTVGQSLASDMRPMALTVTAGHTLEFIGHGHRSLVTVPTTPKDDAPLCFVTLMVAYDHLRTAEGATAALLARVFGERA